MTVWVDSIGVRHFPRPTRAAIIVRHGLFRRRELGLVSVERISIFVLCTTDFTWTSSGVDLEDSILRPIDIRIYPHAEEMLVVVCIDAWVDLGAPAFSILAWVHGICIQNSRELDLKLYGTILMKDPVDTILVISSSEDV